MTLKQQTQVPTDFVGTTWIQKQLQRKPKVKINKRTKSLIT